MSCVNGPVACKPPADPDRNCQAQIALTTTLLMGWSLLIIETRDREDCGRKPESEQFRTSLITFSTQPLLVLMITHSMVVMQTVYISGISSH